MSIREIEKTILKRCSFGKKEYDGAVRTLKQMSRAFGDSGIFSQYISPEKWTARHEAHLAIQKLTCVPKRPERGDVIDALRATNRKQEYIDVERGVRIVSQNHITGEPEKGMSVALGPHYSAREYRWVYCVRGRVVGEGSDGEPVITNVKPTCKPMKSNNLVNWDLSRGPTAKKIEIFKRLSTETGVSMHDLIDLNV